jgi:predicted membrane-bound spermidine synthase
LNERSSRGVELALAGALFCSSGAAALVYQVAWQRILALHTGVGVYSVATIVAAFMLGLGLGSQWGGALSARISASRALLMFALLELGIAAFGSLSCWLYYDLLYQRAPWLYRSLLTAAPAHVLALLLPTTLMGMSLPFLVRAIVREGEAKSATIGYLYAINVVGAALGSLLTPWVLARLVGIDGAVLLAAAANAATGLGALGLRALAPPPADATLADASEPEPRPQAGAPAQGEAFAPLLVLYALSGFCSLSLEIVWFRIVDVAVKSTAFTFGTVLAIYLFGLAGGSFAGIALVPRTKDPLRAFLLSQCGVLLYSTAAIALLVRLPPELPLLRWLHAYWPSYEGFQLGAQWEWGALLRLYLAFPVALYAVPTALMGLSFVALQQAVQNDVRLAGRKVGSLQAANIAGGVLGSLGVGLALLSWLGSAGTLRLLTASGLVFAAIGVKRYGARSPFAAAAAALLALAVLLPDGQALWRRLHASPSAIVEEDATSVVAITASLGLATPAGQQRQQMMVNGKGISWLPFGGVHSVIGAAPAIVHERPLELAIIGLGSGDTAWAAGCRKETRSVTVFEIAAPQPRVLEAFLRRRPLPELRRVLRDPRLKLRIADGRNALERDEARYDLIQADPLPPGGAGSGNLYSLEFFAGCARRLKPGGVMCTWSPTPRVYATFCRAFPHVLEFTHGEFQYLIGSHEPLEIEPDAWLTRLASEPLSLYLGPAIAAEVAASLRTARKALVSAEIEIEPNLDLFPRDELRVP